jgi:hypothetical protein
MRTAVEILVRATEKVAYGLEVAPEYAAAAREDPERRRGWRPASSCSPRLSNARSAGSASARSERSPRVARARIARPTRTKVASDRRAR